MNLNVLIKYKEKKLIFKMMLELNREFDDYPTYGSYLRCHSTYGFEDIFQHRKEMDKQLRVAFKEYREARNAAIQELNTVRDVRMRSVIILRNIKEMTWFQIAKAIGGKATSDSLKKAYSRYLGSEYVKYAGKAAQNEG